MRDRIILPAVVFIIVFSVNLTQANDREIVKEDLEINYGQLQNEVFIEDLFISSDNQPKSERIRLINGNGETLKEINLNRGELIKASTSPEPVLRKGEFLMEIHGVSYYLVNE